MKDVMVFHIRGSFSAFLFVVCMCVCTYVYVSMHTYMVYTCSLPDVTPRPPFYPTAAQLNSLIPSPSPSYSVSPSLAGLPLSVIICPSILESLASWQGFPVTQLHWGLDFLEKIESADNPEGHG